MRQDGQRLLVVLADGAGGTGGGAAAAQAFCDLVLAESRGERPWTDVLCDIDERLAQLSNVGLCTGIAIEVVAGALRGASVGDSGAWLVTDVSILDLTELQQAKPLLGSGEVKPIAIVPCLLEGRLLVASDGLFKYGRRSDIQRCATTGSLDDCAGALLDCVRLRNGRFQDDVSIVLAEAAAVRSSGRS